MAGDAAAAAYDLVVLVGLLVLDFLEGLLGLEVFPEVALALLWADLDLGRADCIPWDSFTARISRSTPTSLVEAWSVVSFVECGPSTAAATAATRSCASGFVCCVPAPFATDCALLCLFFLFLDLDFFDFVAEEPFFAELLGTALVSMLLLTSTNRCYCSPILYLPYHTIRIKILWGEGGLVLMCTSILSIIFHSMFVKEERE